MDPRVTPFVEAARGYVRRALKLELDMSPESLAYVDHYARTTREAQPDGKLAADVLRLAASALGAYFGEVLLAAHGGQWVIESGAEAAPERWRIELDPPSLSLSPVALAAGALAGDEVPGYDDRVTPSLQDAVALQQLLEATPPIDADMFYSLTGRYETIEKMRDLLAEIARRRDGGSGEAPN
jgi:hypothetical protein